MLLTSFVLLGTLAPWLINAADTKPNIVLIVADDQGFANIGYHNSTVLTPRIDALAHAGVTLEGYYVQPVCSPTRSSLMTGRYTYRLGTQATVIRADVPFGVPLKETFVAENMKDAGYTTALFGKWHLGFYQRAYTPLSRGFDFHLGYFQGTVDYYTHQGYGYGGSEAGLDWHRNNETSWFADSGNFTSTLIVPEAINFMKDRQADGKPFFLYLPFHLIHGPNEVPPEFLSLYPEKNLEATARSQGMCGVCDCAWGEKLDRFPAGFGPDPEYGVQTRPGNDVTWKDCRTVLAMASALDAAVGSIVDGLEAHNHYNNTIIIYTSDNGAQGGQGGTSFPLKGFKTQLYEGGMRVPGFVSGGSPLLPQSVRGKINTKLYHITDWLPTIVHLGGGDTTKNEALDGFNIWDSIVNLNNPSPRDEILHNFNPACGQGYVNPPTGIRVGDWKLLVGCFNISTLRPNIDATIELYNVITDPYEYNECSTANPKKVNELMSRLVYYVSSKDQVPPTLFYPYNETGDMVAPWNYQCPQCPHGGALKGPQGYHFDPWCDSVTCGQGPPAPPPTARPPPPGPTPTKACPWTMFEGGMGAGDNPDFQIEKTSGWEDCCVLCVKNADCQGWTFFDDASSTCHLHKNQKSQHPGIEKRITGLRSTN